jgi:hypothetical protein
MFGIVDSWERKRSFKKVAFQKARLTQRQIRMPVPESGGSNIREIPKIPFLPALTKDIVMFYGLMALH